MDVQYVFGIWPKCILLMSAVEGTRQNATCLTTYGKGVCVSKEEVQISAL